MGNFFAELKRRHIYRVAAAYAVVAWVLIQLVSNVSPMLRLPDWAGTLVLVLLVTGFPVAMLFAWIQDGGPAEGALSRVSTGKLDWVLIGALVTVIAIFVYQQIAPLSGTRTVQTQQAGVSAARNASLNPGSAISIAVMPFANLSSDKEQEFFSDGMTDEIAGALAKVPDLRVVARSSAFKFKGQNEEARVVGQALGATHLIEGSVRQAGNRVRISAQLIQAENGLQIWSENYDRDLTDIFAIQEDIARAITASLRMPLGLKPGENLVNNRTKDESLHEEYLRAKALVRTRTPGGGTQGLNELTEATERLKKVLVSDPEFAPAWALLGLAYGYIPLRHPAVVVGDNLEEARAVVVDALPKGEAAANRAIVLDPKNADGYVALGLIQHVRGRQIEAGEAFSKAMGLDPTNPDGLHLYSDFLADTGHVKQSVPLRQQLHALEPFIPNFEAITARILLGAGQYDAAMKVYEPFLGNNAVAAEYAVTLAAKGQYGEAADILQKARGVPPATLDAAVRLLRSAPAVAPPQTLPQLGRQGRLNFIYAFVGAPERVLAPYEDGLKIGYVGPGDNVYLWIPSIVPVRKTERFKAYMRNVGMVDYWRKSGWPDRCHPAGADDFACD